MFRNTAVIFNWSCKFKDRIRIKIAMPIGGSKTYSASQCHHNKLLLQLLNRNQNLISTWPPTAVESQAGVVNQNENVSN